MRGFRIGLLVVMGTVAARADDAGWQARLAAAVERAVGRNPEIAAMESGIEAADHRVAQSEALPDPQLDLALKDFPVTDFSLSRDDFTMEVVGLQQAFPGAGKRPARRAAAEAELAGVSAMHEQHRVRLSADVADVFFSLGEIDARIAITEQSRERLRRIAESATERYRVGKGAQADVLRANLEVTAAEEKLVALRGDRRRAVARWNSLQALSAGDPVPAVDLPAADPSVPAVGELLRDAEERSPSVAVAAAGIRRAEQELSLARLEARPDFTAMGYYAHRIDYEDLAGLGVSFSLPFVQGKRIRERQAEKGAELSGARANLETVRNAIRQSVEEAYADLERSTEQARLYRSSILPQAETNVQAAQEAYAVGQVDFLTYVRAALDRDAYASELAVRRAGAWRAAAALQAAAGLPALPGVSGKEGSHD